MKHMRKTPVEAMQWRPDNRTEFDKFVRKYTKNYTYYEYNSGNILLTYWDFNEHKHATVIPKFGWVVREGNTLQFYKDSTFRKTFEEVREDDHKGIDWEGMNKTIKEAFNGFDDVFKGFNHVFGSETSKETLDAIKMSAHINPDDRLTKLLNDIDKGIREKVEKQLSDGLKDMAGSDTHKATFESVLDEMKELHAKKNKDYGDAAHKNFLKYGSVASLSRLSEKMQRAEHILLSGKCEVKDEPLTSTLIDMAITSAMLYMELKNKDDGKI